ncbi:MFS transporter [Ectothiorhodospiraceae bacterium 2226]|nr:MFS transporter [Ectothiorhodospiraceae bacterium 2226]
MSESRPEPQGLRHLFRALRFRNYRLYFTGQLISLAGTWMSFVALGWLVYRLTGDPLMLGLVGFCLHVPTFLLSPVAGALVDRWDSRRVLVTAQGLDLVVMLGLAGLTLSGAVEVWHLLLGCVALGLTKAFEIPARHALVVEVVEERSYLANAIALNSSLFHGARLVGPMMAGALLTVAGEGLIFLLDALSYLPVMASLLLLRLARRLPPPPPRPLLQEVGEGLAYVLGFRPVRALMGLVALVALLGLPYGTLLPVFADAVLGGGARTYALLMAASGAGALFGALYLAARTSVLGLGRLIAGATTAFGAALVLLALSDVLWFSVLVLVVAGLSSMLAMAGANTIIQTLVGDALRGRVMSLFAMTFMGAMPLGTLLAGKVARLAGAPAMVMVGGLACIAAGAAFGYRLPGLRAQVREVYVERGILPPLPEAPARGP